MAKKKSAKTSKSQKIRDYMAKFPSAKAAEVAKATGAEASLVYQVKSADKARSRRKSGIRSKATPRGSLEVAADLIVSAGSANAALEAISKAEELARKLKSSV